jgi:hypothetical protein
MYNVLFYCVTYLSVCVNKCYALIDVMRLECVETFLLQIEKQFVSQYLITSISTQLWTLLDFHFLYGYCGQVCAVVHKTHVCCLITPPEFYLWGVVKIPVYRHSRCSFRCRLGDITNFIWNIPDAELVCVFANKLKWVDTCLQACGTTFPALVVTVSFALEIYLCSYKCTCSLESFCI